MHFREEPVTPVYRHWMCEQVGCNGELLSTGEGITRLVHAGSIAAASAATKIGRTPLTRGSLTSPLTPSDLMTLILRRDLFTAPENSLSRGLTAKASPLASRS